MHFESGYESFKKWQGSFLCLGAREREQRKEEEEEEEDNITTVVKRSKRRVTWKCVCVWGGGGERVLK